MNKEYYNASGCADPTAYDAMQNIQQEQRAEAAADAHRLIKAVKALIAENGFVLLNRIELKDIKSGTIFK